MLTFVLVAGVHTVHLLANSNPGAANLPPMRTFAQPPGRELLVRMNFGAGERYHLQCDRHAPIGMIGTLDVGQQ